MTTDVLRITVAILAMVIVGAALVTAARYGRAAYRLGRAPGRILARHVTEVAAGTAGLTLGYAAAIIEQLGYTVWLTATPRLWLYLVSMVLLLVGLVEIHGYQQARARSYPQRQEQVREAIRAAIDRHRITGPRSADYAAVLATNAVLTLEGTPALPEPEAPSRGEKHTDQAAQTGRHALRKDRRTP